MSSKLQVLECCSNWTATVGETSTSSCKTASFLRLWRTKTVFQVKTAKTRSKCRCGGLLTETISCLNNPQVDTSCRLMWHLLATPWVWLDACQEFVWQVFLVKFIRNSSMLFALPSLLSPRCRYHFCVSKVRGSVRLRPEWEGFLALIPARITSWKVHRP